MASFCGNCGSPRAVDSAFCVKCGAPAGNRPNPVASPPQPQYSAPLTPAAGSSSALKIVVVLLCCLVVGGAVVIGGVFYLAHRVKQAVVEKAAENGVDLNAIANASQHTASSERSLPRACDLLTKRDVSQLIGQPIDRTEVRDAMCAYYGPAGLSGRLAQEQASNTYKQAQVPGATVSPSDVATSVDQLANSMGAQAGMTGTSGEMPLLMLAVVPDGKAQMTAVSATKAIFGNLGRSADSPGIGFGNDIPGLGDKAIRIPKLGLNVLKGDILIRIIPAAFPDSDARTVAVARAILPKI